MSRRQLFEAIERPVMRELPQDDFEYAEWVPKLSPRSARRAAFIQGVGPPAERGL